MFETIINGLSELENSGIGTKMSILALLVSEIWWFYLFWGGFGTKLPFSRHPVYVFPKLLYSADSHDQMFQKRSNIECCISSYSLANIFKYVKLTKKCYEQLWTKKPCSSFFQAGIIFLVFGNSIKKCFQQ